MIVDETKLRLRRCFQTADGKITLGWLLANSGYFDKCETAEQTAVVNFMKKLLREMGIISIENINSYVDKIMEIPVNLDAKNGHFSGD